MIRTEPEDIATELAKTRERLERTETALAEVRVLAAEADLGRQLLDRVRRHKWIFERLYKDHAEAIDRFLGPDDTQWGEE